jgi:hypothetical protein
MRTVQEHRLATMRRHSKTLQDAIVNAEHKHLNPVFVKALLGRKSEVDRMLYREGREIAPDWRATK